MSPDNRTEEVCLMTRITTKFNATATADEVIAGVDLSGKPAIVTGGASGIGVETARSLARAGADVTIAVRNLEAGAEVAMDIIESTGNPAVHWPRSTCSIWPAWTRLPTLGKNRWTS